MRQRATAVRRVFDVREVTVDATETLPLDDELTIVWRAYTQPETAFRPHLGEISTPRFYFAD